MMIDGRKEKFGEVNENSTKLEFNPDEPLIGLFAYQSDYRINQIGVYTLNTTCAATMLEEPEILELERLAAEERENARKPKKKRQERTDPMLVTILIFVAAFVVIALAIGGLMYVKKV